MNALFHAAAGAGDARRLQTLQSIRAEFLPMISAELRQRMKYAFIKTYKPVLDDEPYRSFETMEEYRRWCEDNLPEWLGYGREEK